MHLQDVEQFSKFAVKFYFYIGVTCSSNSVCVADAVVEFVKNMESLPTVLPRGAVIRGSAVDDSELSSWKRNRRWQRRHNYSEGHLNDRHTPQPLPELLSCGTDHSTLLSQSKFHRMTPKYRRQSIPLCAPEKDRAFHRSASGSHIAVTTSSVYAGARFSEAPSPKLLPLPPRHWLDEVGTQRPAVCGEMTKQLKSVLQVK